MTHTEKHSTLISKHAKLLQEVISMSDVHFFLQKFCADLKYWGFYNNIR